MRLSRPHLLLQLLSAAVEDEDPAAVIEDPEAEHLDAAVQELHDAEQLEATGTLFFVLSRAPFFSPPPPEAPPHLRGGRGPVEEDEHQRWHRDVNDNVAVEEELAHLPPARVARWARCPRHRDEDAGPSIPSFSVV